MRVFAVAQRLCKSPDVQPARELCSLLSQAAPGRVLLVNLERSDRGLHGEVHETQDITVLDWSKEEESLRDALLRIGQDFDVILFDLPIETGPLRIEAMKAADEVIAAPADCPEAYRETATVMLLMEPSFVIMHKGQSPKMDYVNGKTTHSFLG